MSTNVAATLCAALCLLASIFAGTAAAQNPSDRFYFLSQVGGCAKLVPFLQSVGGTANANATLVVDQACIGGSAITQPLVLPNRFTLAGVGIDGEGILQFVLPENVKAIRFAPSGGVPSRMSSIRDLNIVGGCCGQTGIDVSNSQFVFIRNVRVQGFAYGLSGGNAFSVFVDDSVFNHNATGIVMGANTTSWRVRDTVTSQGLYGIQIHPTARGHLVSGGRIESNSSWGIQVTGQMNVIENTWFEGNGGGGGVNGILLNPQAQKNRILGNTFSSQLIANGGVETQMCFNMSFAPGSGDVNAC